VASGPGFTAEGSYRTKDRFIEICILSDGKIDLIPIAQEVWKLQFQRLDGIGAVCAMIINGTFKARVTAGPDSFFRIERSAEEDIRSFLAIRDQNQNRFRLMETGEVMKVAVLSEGVFDVTVSDNGRCTRHDGDAVFLHRTHQPTPTLLEFSWAEHLRHGLVSSFRRHGLKFALDDLNPDANILGQFGIGFFIGILGRTGIETYDLQKIPQNFLSLSGPRCRFSAVSKALKKAMTPFPEGEGSLTQVTFVIGEQQLKAEVEIGQLPAGLSIKRLERLAVVFAGFGSLLAEKVVKPLGRICRGIHAEHAGKITVYLTGTTGEFSPIHEVLNIIKLKIT
jgi:hypothetical protein